MLILDYPDILVPRKLERKTYEEENQLWKKLSDIAQNYNIPIIVNNKIFKLSKRRNK